MTVERTGVCSQTKPIGYGRPDQNTTTLIDTAFTQRVLIEHKVCDDKSTIGRIRQSVLSVIIFDTFSRFLFYYPIAKCFIIKKKFFFVTPTSCWYMESGYQLIWSRKVPENSVCLLRDALSFSPLTRYKRCLLIEVTWTLKSHSGINITITSRKKVFILLHLCKEYRRMRITLLRLAGENPQVCMSRS